MYINHINWLLFNFVVVESLKYDRQASEKKKEKRRIAIDHRGCWGSSAPLTGTLVGCRGAISSNRWCRKTTDMAGWFQNTCIRQKNKQTKKPQTNE